MYVCICKAVTDAQIKQAIENGACTRRALFNCLGVGSDCGKCNSHIKEMIGDKLHQHVIMQPA